MGGLSPHGIRVEKKTGFRPKTGRLVMRNWGRLEWLCVVGALVSAALVVALVLWLLPVLRGCGQAVEEYVQESTETVSPAECKQRCVSINP